MSRKKFGKLKYQGEQTRKLGRQEITGEVFVNNIINISNRDLTLLQQSEGTTATLNYLQEAASQLLPRIMSRLAAIRSKTEDPALLRDYQKALFELIPYFAVVDESIASEGRDYMQYLSSTHKPTLTSASKEAITTITDDMGKFQENYVEIMDCIVHILKQKEDLHHSDQDYLEKALKIESEEWVTRELSEQTPLLSKTLALAGSSLAEKLDAIQETNPLISIQKQLAVMKFLFVAYNTPRFAQNFLEIFELSSPLNFKTTMILCQFVILRLRSPFRSKIVR